MTSKISNINPKKEHFDQEIIEQVKTISILDYLSSVGYIKEKCLHGRAWYKDIFTDGQKTGSFNVSLKKNLWNDFSIDKGGDIIKLVELLEGLSFQDAVQKLILFSGNFESYMHQYSSFTDKKPSLEFDHEESFGTNRSLTKYALNTRNIHLQVASNYLREVYYIQNGKKRWGLALKEKNQSGGINISCAFKQNGGYVKRVLGSNNFSYLPGDENNEIYVIFEGFWDFLAAMTYCNKTTTEHHVIILNSTGNLARALDFLKDKSIRQLKLYLDNDQTGRGATKRVSEEFISLARNCSHIYEGYKDFNDMLMGKKLK